MPKDEQLVPTSANELLKPESSLDGIAARRMEQHGDRNFQVGEIGNFTQNVSVLVMPSQKQESKAVISDALMVDNDYFHLVVVGGCSPESGVVTVSKEYALTASTAEEVTKELATLSPEAIEVLKTYPALIMGKNKHYGRADASQNAVYGFITDIIELDEAVELHFQVLNRIPQQTVLSLADSLAIQRAYAWNELDDTHWAVKKVKLTEVLKSAGVRVFTMA